MTTNRIFDGVQIGDDVMAWRNGYRAYMQCRVLNFGFRRDGQPYLHLVPMTDGQAWRMTFCCHPRRIVLMSVFTAELGPVYPQRGERFK